MDLYQVCLNYCPEAKNGLTSAGGHMFYIGLYRENVKKSCLKPQDLES